MKPRLLTLALAISLSVASAAAQADTTLQGRAVLPADTFAAGPTSGAYIGGGANGRTAPFINKQPVQGFSSVLKNNDGTFYVMADNGFGSLENSADFNLRVYHIRPQFKTKEGGSGEIQVIHHFESCDPDRKFPFAITNHFSSTRVLTGADFDTESMQIASDGTFWFSDEFGPFLIHIDATCKVLDAPVALPDYANSGKEVRSPQNPYDEESNAVRVMNAVRAHAQANGANSNVVFSPWHVIWDNARPIGSRIVEIRKNGTPINLAQYYTVTANSFIAAGGDNFTVFNQGVNRAGGPLDLDALIAHNTSLPQPFGAILQGRIARLD